MKAIATLLIQVAVDGVTLAAVFGYGLPYTLNLAYANAMLECIFGLVVFVGFLGLCVMPFDKLPPMKSIPFMTSVYRVVSWIVVGNLFAFGWWWVGAAWLFCLLFTHAAIEIHRYRLTEGQ